MKKNIICYGLSMFLGVGGYFNPLQNTQIVKPLELFSENSQELTNGIILKESQTEKVKIKETELYAKAAVLIDADSKRVLYEKNAEQILPMASTTKIMTAIVVLENAKLEDLVKVSQYASSMPDVQLNIKEGEQYRVEDLLYSLMLESHNDTAVALAEHVGGTVEGFAELMNKKAKELGCDNTYFITPNGLDKTDENGTHSTTAADLAKIMAYCIKESPKREEFLKITRTASYSFSNTEGKRSFSCSNHNAFLNMMDGALSGKTGFTNDAGYCYVGALEKDNKTFVVALLACGWPNNKSYKWSDTKKLMNYGLENYDFKKFADVKLDQSELSPINVNDGQTEKIGETATAKLKIVEKDVSENINSDKEGLLMNKDEEVDVVYDIQDEVVAPTKEGDVVGTIQYLVDGEVWKSNNVIITNSITKIDYIWCYKKVIRMFFL